MARFYGRRLKMVGKASMTTVERVVRLGTKNDSGLIRIQMLQAFLPHLDSILRSPYQVLKKIITIHCPSLTMVWIAATARMMIRSQSRRRRRRRRRKVKTVVVQVY